MPDPVTPTPVDPTTDKMYALITAAITAIGTAVVAFLNISGEQKAAVMGAIVTAGGLFAYIFVTSHHAAVQANATLKAAVLSRPVLPVSSSYSGPMGPR